MAIRIRKSLTLKWTVFSVLLATIPLAIASFSIIQIYQDNLKKSVITIEKEKANIVVGMTRSFFEKITSNLRSLSIDEHFRQGSSLGHIKSLLEDFLNQNDYLSKLTLLNEKGKETIKVSKYRTFKRSDLKDQSKTEIFQVASNLQTYYGGFKLTEDIVPTMMIGVQIGQRKRPTDVLSAEIDLRYLWNLIQQIQIGEKGMAYVVNGEGDLIVHPDTTRVTSRKNVKHLLMVNRALAGEEGSLEFEDATGEKYLVVYKPVKELGWGVIVQVPIEEAYTPLRHVAAAALKWILIALSIAIIFSLFLTRKLTLPIKNLSKELREVAKGNLDTYIQPTTKDEIGVLAESFNQMIKDLKLSREALKEAEQKYRSIFENSKDMFFITSADGNFLDMNQAGVDMLGYASKEEMFKIFVRDTYLNPAERDRFTNAMKNGYVKNFEAKLKRKDGIPIDVMVTAIAKADATGKIISYEGIIKDISDRKRMEEELVQRTRELEALNEMGALINQTLVDLNTIFPIALEKAMSLTGFEMGAIYLLSEEGDLLKMKYHNGHPPAMVEEGKVLKYGEGVSGKAIHLRQPVVASINEYSSFRVSPVLIGEGIQTLVGFPLLAKGKAIGTITLLSRSPRELTQREINLLKSIGNQIGLALENSKLFEETKKRLGELTILYEIMKISASTLDLDEVVKKIIDSLKSFFKFEALGILWVDENTRRLLPHPASNHELSMRDMEKLKLCVGKGITGWVAEKGEPLLVNDVRKDGRYICGDERISSEMCLPLKLGQKVIGVIDVQSRELNAFTENDLRLFTIASRQIATIIENIRLQDEIKQSEERYRTVVETALDGVCVIGRDYRFKYVNEKFADIQGHNREELIGAELRDYLDDESKRLLADREDQRKRGVEPSPYFELNILRKDGGMRRVEVSAQNIKDSKGDVNTIAILKDITDKKRMEEQLLQTEKLRALGEMASGVAHDFNNALAAILGNTELLLHTAKDEDLRGSLKVIEKVARESARTVKRLQEFTRKRVHQELFKINVNDVIIDAIEITKPKWKDEAQAKGIHIDMASKFVEISTVIGDASELREVITNMIFNAIDAMPEGGRIEIQAFQKRGKVYIQISDTGVGMAEEVRKKIFEPFFTTKPFSNAGLGLSMSYGIVKRFGGEIEVESILGHGTTFTIILPIGLEGKEQLTVPSIMKREREARILVIDDEETVRSVLSRILSQVKHRVTVAENGEEGIRLFKEEGFDIVLTDLGMPGISGWEVGKTIKRMSPRTPVGMITGWGEVNQATIKENGIDFVISKPFQFNQILKVIDETIASKGKLFMT